jgi:hypothetical protein
LGDADADVDDDALADGEDVVEALGLDRVVALAEGFRGVAL